MAAQPTMKIKLSKGSTSGEVQPTTSESRTSSCPNHLVLADLPVGRAVGEPPRAGLVVKTVGRIASRSLGERVHFCLKCDFPIAVYGRLSPCTHVFCLDCAQSGSSCYVCEKMIEKIQSIKRGEPLFICSVELCLKSFTAKVEFESHVEEVHNQSLKDKMEEDKGAESDAIIQLPAAAAPSTSSTVGVLPKPAAASTSTTVGVPPLLPKPAAAAAAVAAVPPLLSNPPVLASSRLFPPLMGNETYYVAVTTIRQPLFEPALAPPANVLESLHGGAPFNMGPSLLGVPPNLQAQPRGMGLLPPPRGAPPMTNLPAPHLRHPHFPPPRRLPHHRPRPRPRNN